MARWLPAGLALSRMRPYSVAVCIVRNRSGLSFASSDPYLSTATPLAAVPAALPPEELRYVLRVRRGLGCC